MVDRSERNDEVEDAERRRETDDLPGEPSISDLLESISSDADGRSRSTAPDEARREQTSPLESDASLADLAERIFGTYRDASATSESTRLEEIETVLENGSREPSLDDIRREVRTRRLDGDATENTRRTESATGAASTDGRSSSASGSPTLDPNLLRDNDSILLLEPFNRAERAETCLPFLSTRTDDRQYLLFVTLTEPVHDRLAILEELRSPPEAVAVVSRSDRRSSAADLKQHGAAPVETTVTVVPDPSDLTRIGIAISKTISKWPETARISVCFHSLSVLLQYSDLQRVFRFLHVLRSQFAQMDVTGHFHVDADAHDQQTIATLRPLFDVVLEPADGGGFSVSR